MCSRRALLADYPVTALCFGRKLAQGGAMTNRDEVAERLDWLERKVVRLLYAAISAASLFVGWVLADAVVGDRTSWSWSAVLLGTWIILGFVLQRYEFRGAPRRIDLIDP
jgi:hypothetical protein